MKRGLYLPSLLSIKYLWLFLNKPVYLRSANKCAAFNDFSAQFLQISIKFHTEDSAASADAELSTSLSVSKGLERHF